MLVADVMTTDVVTVDVEAMLADAVARQLSEGVGSVVVVDGDTPMGLVTETDALRAAAGRGVALSEIPIRDLASPSLVTTDPDRTVQHVARQMADQDVKKVLVTEELEILGIVTLTDVVWHLSDIREEAAALAERDWDPHD